MKVLESIKSASLSRRFLFTIASLCSAAAVAAIIYWLFGNRIESLSAFEVMDWYPAGLVHLAVFYLCADLAVELFRMLRPSSTSWTDDKHFKIVARVFIIG